MNNTGGSRQLFVCVVLETAVHVLVLGKYMQCNVPFIELSTQSFMTDPIAPSETQTLPCTHSTIQLASNPDLRTFQNLHGYTNTTRSSLDKHIAYAYPTQPHLCTCSQWSSPHKKKSRNKFYKNHLKMKEHVGMESQKSNQTR